MTSEKESIKMTDEDYKRIEQGKAEDMPKFILVFLLIAFAVYLFFS